MASEVQRRWIIVLLIAISTSVALAAPNAVSVRVARASARNRARFASGRDPQVTRAWWPTVPPGAQSEILALGAEAFALFPTAIEVAWEQFIGDDEALRRFGVRVDSDGEAAGLLFVETRSGWRTAYSCVLCHSQARHDGRVVMGAANAALDYGAMLAETFRDHPEAARWRSWGPGRVDVTDDGRDNPLRVPDLVGLDDVTYLQQSGAFVVAASTGLADRIEEVLRRSPLTGRETPVLATALATWLRALPGPERPRKEGPGGALFARHCERCHDGPALGGRMLVEATIVGTDERAAHDGLRGTGSYRVPSLLGAGTRERFFHDGALRRLSDVIDPARLRDDFAAGAFGPGAVPGHPYGTTLDPPSRRALVEVLQTSRW